MFPIQMTGQRDKFVTALGAVVANADNLDDVMPFIEQLGRDHRRFSVVTEHYMAVGATLMATLKRFLGASWDADLADTWSQAYGLIAKVMVAAAEQHEELAPALWEADVVHVERRSMDVAVVEVVPRQPFVYRARTVGSRRDPAAARGCGAISALRTPRIRRVVCSSTSSRSRAEWCPPRWYAT